MSQLLDRTINAIYSDKKMIKLIYADAHKEELRKKQDREYKRRHR